MSDDELDEEIDKQLDETVERLKELVRVYSSSGIDWDKWSKGHADRIRNERKWQKFLDEIEELDDE